MSANKVSSALRAAFAPLGLAVALVAAPGLAQADAVAQSILSLSNIRFGSNPAGAITALVGTDSGDVSAAINGGAPSTASANPGLFAGFTLNQAVGPNAGSYVPGTALTGSPTLNYVGSSSIIGPGDPFVTGVTALTDNTVSLTPGGMGTAASNAGLLSTFQITVAAGTELSISFNADAFLRAYLDPVGAIGNAQASYNWTISLTRNGAGGGQVFSWSPDGNLGTGITGGVESADAFSMNDTVASLIGGLEDSRGPQSGAFAARTNGLAGGTYTVNIRHSSSADAAIVPEPSVLSLAGLALLGMGYASRRRRAAK